MMYNASPHVVHRIMTAPLSKELRRIYGIRAVPLRKGDTVLVKRGDYVEISGKVAKVNYRNRKIQIEGATRERVGGRSINVSIHPSKVMITKLELGDKLRVKALERKGKALGEVAETGEESGGGV